MTYASLLRLQSSSAPGVRRRLSLLVLGVLAAALAMTPRPAAATYQLEGPKWPNQPGPGVCCAVLQYETNVIIWANNADATGWQNGAAAWNNSPALVWVNPAPGNSPINLIDTTDSVDGRLEAAEAGQHVALDGDTCQRGHRLHELVRPTQRQCGVDLAHPTDRERYI